MGIVNGMVNIVRIKNANFCQNNNVMAHILILDVDGTWILVMVINNVNKFLLYLTHK